MNNNEKFMLRAIKLSKESVDNNGGPFGCIIVKNTKIIAEGSNQVTKNNDPTAHAEIVAIRNACQKLQTFDLSGVELYTSCEPCPMCLGAIYWARPSKVYFGCNKNDAAAIDFDDDFIYKEISIPNSQRKIPFVGFMREEAMAAFNAWTDKKDKVSY